MLSPLDRMKMEIGMETSSDVRKRAEQQAAQQQPQEETGVVENLWDGLKNIVKAGVAADNVTTEAGANILDAIGDQLKDGAVPNSFIGDVFKYGAKYYRDKAKRRDELVGGTENVTPANYNDWSSAIPNAVAGTVANMASGAGSFIHADESANKLNSIAQALTPQSQPEVGLNADYMFNPAGALYDLESGLTSTAMLAPLMFLAPEFGAATLASKIGGDALVRALLGTGSSAARRYLAKSTAQSLPDILRYAPTAGIGEGIIEGGNVRRQNLAQGLSDDEATRNSIKAALLNAGYLTGSNLIEGGLFFAPLKATGALGKAGQIAGRSLLGGLNQSVEEAVQQVIENAYTGRPLTENTWSSFSHGILPGIALGGLGAGRQALKRDENEENYRRGADNNYSVKDYGNIYSVRKKLEDAKDAQSQVNVDNYQNEDSLVGWAKDISGSQNDSTINKVIATAKKYGLDPRLALAVGTAESNLNQNEISEAGAIGVMQLMPETAEGLGVNPYDEDENIEGGVKYLKQMLDMFNGDTRLATAAYNAGHGAVQKYGGIPPYGETENYVERIHGYLGSQPEYSSQNSQSENIYSGENGQAEGKYWNRQTDNVSIEGLQPQGLNALDMLGKWFYEKTGKPLILTSGVDGTSHVAGEHSHYDGWKFDVNDWDGNSDGHLVTADGSKGTLTDEFIAYGRSLGLGMNWEGDHIDVALDGTQWDGNGENAGGFNPEKLNSMRQASPAPSTSRTLSISSPTETTENENYADEAEEEFKPIKFSDDDETQNLFDEFASNQAGKFQGKDTEKFNFFNSFFTDQDDFMPQFQNTQENREKILENYGDEFRDFLASKGYFEESLGKPEQKVKSQLQQPQEQPKPQQGQVEFEGIKSPPKQYLGSEFEKLGTIEKIRQIQNWASESGKTKLLEKAREIENSGDKQAQEKFVRDNPLPKEFIQRWEEENAEEPEDSEETSALETPAQEKTTAENKKSKVEIPAKLLEIARAKVDMDNSNARIRQGEALLKIAKLNKFKVDKTLERTAKQGFSKAVPQLKALLEEQGFLNSGEEIQETAADRHKKLRSEYQSKQKELDEAYRAVQEIHADTIDVMGRRKAFKNFNRLLNERNATREKFWESTRQVNEEWRQNRNAPKSDYRKAEWDYQNEIAELKEETEKARQKVEKLFKLGDFDARKKALKEYQSLQQQLDSKIAERDKFMVSDDHEQDLITEYEFAPDKRKKEILKELIESGQRREQSSKEYPNFTPTPRHSKGRTPSVKTPEEILKRGINYDEQSDQFAETPAQPKIEGQPQQEVSQPAKPVQQQNPDFENVQQQTKQILENIKAKESKPTKAETSPTSKKTYHFDGTQAEQQEITPAENISETQEISQTPTQETSTAPTEKVSEVEETPTQEKSGEKSKRVIKATKEKADKYLQDFSDGKVSAAKTNEKLEKLANRTDENQKLTDAEKAEVRDYAEKLKSDLVDYMHGEKNLEVSETEKSTEETPQEKSESVPKKSESKIKSRPTGKSEKILTDSQKSVDTHYKVVPADELIPSHEWNGDAVFENKNYPADEKLQPRESRKGNAMTLNAIKRANNLNPELLTDSKNVNQGAPLVRGDGVVLNGNGRILSINRAYKNGKADGYKKHLIDNAEKFGLDAEEISKIENPVLIREVNQELTPELTNEIINSKTGGESFNDTELAREDAKKISFKPTKKYIEGGNLNDLLYDVANEIVPESERNKYFRDGGLTTSGVNRAKNALFAKAYGEKGLLDDISNSGEEFSQNLQDALLESAAHIIQANKNRPNYRIGEVISDAAKKYVELRKKRKNVTDYIREERETDSMFEPQRAAELDIIEEINDKVHKRKELPRFFKNIANRIIAEENEKSGMFQSEEADKRVDEIVADAKKKSEESQGQNLFEVEGNPDVAITDDMIVADKNLTSQQKTFTEIGNKMGLPIKFFKGDPSFRGVLRKGVSYINVNNKNFEQTFYHEAAHFLSHFNPELFEDVCDAANITEKQRQAIREKSSLYENLSDRQIDEEILADNFEDLAKRSELFKNIGKQDKTLAEKFISWLKTLMDKFTSYFSNPKGGLMRTQRAAMQNAFDNVVRSIVDGNGNKIFRVSRETHEIQRFNGEKLPEVDLQERRKKFENADDVYSFAGAKAKTADKDSLEQAQIMEKQGKTYNSIFKKTGWLKGKDGKWRFEIPDNLDKIDFSPLKGNGMATLGEIYDNPKLYEAYPELENLKITSTTFNAYSPKLRTIRLDIRKQSGLNEVDNPRRTLIHEIQHAIQSIEDFARGGSPESVDYLLQDSLEDIKTELYKLDPYGDYVNEVNLAYEDATTKKELKDLLERRAVQNGTHLSESERKEIVNLIDRKRAIEKALRNKKLSAEEKYSLLGGEQEANTAMGRANYAGRDSIWESFAKQTPKIHSDKALIVFSGKSFSMASMSNSPDRYSIDPSDNSNKESKFSKLLDWGRIIWKGKPKEKRWRNEVTKLFQRATGYKIAYRHFEGDDTVMVDDVTQLITVDGAYKFDELMPKVAKIIAKKVGLPQTDEMQNYITEWVLRGTPTNSPQESQLFEKAMTENPVVYERLRKAQQLFQDYADMSALDKYGSIIAYEKPNPNTQSFMDEMEETFVDDTSPLGKFTEEIRKKHGDRIADALDSQFAARMYRGGGGIIELMTSAKNDRQIKDIRELLTLENPFINFGNFVPIEQIIKMAGGRKNLRRFDGYLVALQEKEFHEKNKQAGEKIYETTMSEQECDDAIKEGKAEFDAAQKAYRNFTNTLLDFSLDSGLISKKQYFAIKNSWKNYATTARVFDDATEIDVDSFMPKKGSRRDVVSPIMTLINNTGKIVKAAQKNKIKIHLKQVAVCEGFGKNISEVEARNGNEPTITYKENGKTKYLATTAEVKRVIDSLDGDYTQGKFVTRAIQTVSSWVSNTYTLLSLDFASGNLFRDTQEAYLYGETRRKTLGGILKHHLLNNPIANLVRAFKMLPEIWNQSALYLEWKAMGGSQATFVSPDMNRTQIKIDDLTKSRYEKFFKSGVKGFFEQCLTSLQKFSEFTEEMTRLAVYKSAKDALAENREGGKATYGDMRKAAFASRNATIDFARGGSAMKKINKCFRFSNVAIQDMNKSWTVLKNLDPRNLSTEEGRLKIFDVGLKLFFGAMLPTIAFWAMNHDEDWYKYGTPQWQKDTSWILGEGVKIPKSLSLVGKIVSMATEDALSDNPTSAKRIAQPILESLPSLLPTLLIPITEAMTNYSFFYGGALVPQKEQRLPSYKQYSRNTSELAKWFGDSAFAHFISRAIYDKDDGISPRKIDHVLEGYLGFIGRGIEGVSNAPSVIFSDRKISFESSEFPILKRFSFDPYKNPQIVADYYNKRSEQEHLFNAYKLDRKQGKKELPRGLDLKLYRKIQSVEGALKNISARERKLLENPKIPADELKKQLQILEEKRVALCKKALGRK